MKGGGRRSATWLHTLLGRGRIDEVPMTAPPPDPGQSSFQTRPMSSESVRRELSRKNSEFGVKLLY